MNLVKRYLFWIIVGVFVLGSVVFWVVGVLLNQSDVSSRKMQFDSTKGQVEQWAGAKIDTIRNPKDVEALKKYRAELAKTEEHIKNQFGALNINIDPARWQEQPPVSDLALFRRWIQQQYTARDEGVARRNKKYDTTTEVLEAADKAMYRAKKAGRNCLKATK